MTAPRDAEEADRADGAEQTDVGAEQTDVGADGAERDDGFSLLSAIGGWGGILDAGLPSLAFAVAFPVSGRDLRVSLIVALVLGAVVAIVRIARRNPLQNVLGGFLVLGLAAYIAHKSGKAEDFYLPGLYINAAYALAYTVANLVRWPLIGLVIGLAAGWGTTWRRDPILRRAFTRASWIWVAFFLIKLAVQLPLYLAGQVVALGIARVAMGWPLWLLVLGATYLVIKASVPSGHWKRVRSAAKAIADRRGMSGS